MGYVQRLDAIRIEISSQRALIEEIHSEINDIELCTEEGITAISLIVFELEDIFSEIDELEDRIAALNKPIMKWIKPSV